MHIREQSSLEMCNKGERFIIFYLDIVHISALDDGLNIFFNKSVTFSIISCKWPKKFLEEFAVKGYK